VGKFRGQEAAVDGTDLMAEEKLSSNMRWSRFCATYIQDMCHIPRSLLDNLDCYNNSCYHRFSTLYFCVAMSSFGTQLNAAYAANVVPNVCYEAVI